MILKGCTKPKRLGLSLPKSHFASCDCGSCCTTNNSKLLSFADKPACGPVSPVTDWPGCICAAPQQLGNSARKMLQTALAFSLFAREWPAPAGRPSTSRSFSAMARVTLALLRVIKCYSSPECVASCLTEICQGCCHFKTASLT